MSAKQGREAPWGLLQEFQGRHNVGLVLLLQDKRRLAAPRWGADQREEAGIVRHHIFERLRGVIVKVGSGAADSPQRWNLG
jgi:hypothetical protein